MALVDILVGGFCGGVELDGRPHKDEHEVESEDSRSSSLLLTMAPLDADATAKLIKQVGSRGRGGFVSSAGGGIRASHDIRVCGLDR